MSMSIKSFTSAAKEHPVKSTLVILMLAVHLTDTIILVDSDLHGNLMYAPIHILAFFLFSYAWITAIKTNKFSTALFYTVMWVLFFQITNYSLDSLKDSTSVSLKPSISQRAALLEKSNKESEDNIQNIQNMSSSLDQMLRSFKSDYS